MRELSCQEVLEHLSEYLDEEARADLVSEVNHHVGGCRHCRVEVDTLRRTIMIFRCEEQVVLPVPLASKLQQALDRAYQDPHFSPEGESQL